MTERILVAEDDRAIRESLIRALELEGYDVTGVSDGAAALIHAAHADLLLLDVMMPGVDGLTVCTALRAQGSDLPILIVTARTETHDRVAGLDAGADDYVLKPFELVELLARMRALLRRTATFRAMSPAGDMTTLHDLHVLQVADLRMDLAARRVWRGDTEVELSRTEFDLLELLMRNDGVVLPHSTIYERIWNYDFGPESKNLTVYISYLRRKIDADHPVKLIHTVRGVGYTVRVP